jgi:8-oxo-dGTP pyrophosphatase MutT (NUDIX family)
MSTRSAARSHEKPTHAGGVVYRRRRRRIEFLLVTARRDPDAWVLPKGRMEPGESAEHTAVREVQEESGVTARVEEFLGQVHVRVRGRRQVIKYYLMAFEREGVSFENRSVSWLSGEQAARHLRFPELQLLIERAQARAGERTSKVSDVSRPSLTRIASDLRRARP